MIAVASILVLERLDMEDKPITGRYPELARIVRRLKGDRATRVVSRRTGVNHSTVSTMVLGDRAGEQNTIKFAKGFRTNPNILLEASGYGRRPEFDAVDWEINTVDEIPTGGVPEPEILYEPDREFLPVPESYRGLDAEGREFVEDAVTVAIEAALRKQRRRNSIGYGDRQVIEPRDDRA